MLKKTLRFLLGYGEAGSTGSGLVKAAQRSLYKLVFSHPIFFFKVFHFFLAPFKTGTAEVQGHKMYLDPGDTLGLSIFGVFEPFMTKVAGQEVKKGDVVLDVGASIGYYTLIFAKLAGESGKVFAFEPAPDMFSILKKNISANGYQNVTAEQKAASNRTGKARLYLRVDNNMAHTMSDSHEGRPSIDIESVRLDDYFSGYSGPVNFIKIDTEGADCAVLQGLTRVLEKNRALKIITEFHPKWLKMFGNEPGEYLDLLARNGFKFYDINEMSGQVEPVSAGELLSLYKPDKQTWTNLLCKR